MKILLDILEILGICLVFGSAIFGIGKLADKEGYRRLARLDELRKKREEQEKMKARRETYKAQFRKD